MSNIELESTRERLCDEPLCGEHGDGTIGCPVPTDPDDIDESATYEYEPGTKTEVEPAEIPSESSCPVCGANPTDQSVAKHRLSNMGYIHDDVRLRCSNTSCSNEWTLGVPIGEFDGGSDLWCDSCDQEQYFVHRVEVDRPDDGLLLHLKCPNCFHFTTTERTADERGIALVGYPQITGSTDGARPEGYNSTPPQ